MIHLSPVTLDHGELLNSSHEAIGGLEWAVTLLNMEKTCDLCNWTKTFPASPIGKLLPNCIPDLRWQVISDDLIMELPMSHGYNACLVIVD